MGRCVVNIIQDEYKTTYQMFSVRGEAAQHKYHCYVDKSGNRWLVADTLNAAENVYVEDKNPKSQGFGGATLTFPLVDGTSISLKGPWHTTAGSLYENTGVDVRDKHYTFCLIALKREGYPTVYRDIVYIDKDPVLGDYHRKEVEDLAQQYADELGQYVYFYKSTKGGSCSTPMVPKKIKQ